MATLKKSALAIVLFCTLSGNLYATTESAVITVTGKVLANTCSVESDINITMPDVNNSVLNGKGIGSQKDVPITLSDCGDSASEVNIKTSGQTDDNDSVAFKNTATADSADGVGLYLYHTDGKTKFNPVTSGGEDISLIPSATNTVTFKAAFVGTKDHVTAGNFKTVINLTLTYK